MAGGGRIAFLGEHGQIAPTENNNAEGGHVARMALRASAAHGPTTYNPAAADDVRAFWSCEATQS
jgi:hypothetical protein